TLPGGANVPLWAFSAVTYAISTVVLWGWADLRVRRLRARWRRQLDAGRAAAAAPGPAPSSSPAAGEGS
ncbi:MAG: hypothetical protein ACYTGB_17580, partial [Planctomycetota bacterium]